MKKFLLSLLTGVLALSAIPFGAVLQADASAKQTVLLEEKFAQDALDESKWTVKGESVSLSADRESGYLSVPRHLEEHHTSIKSEIKNLDYMQFDIQFLPNKWMAIYFSDAEKTQLADYEPEIFMNMGGKGGFASAKGEMSFTSAQIPATMGEWFTMKFKKTSSTTMDIYVCEKGGNIDQASVATTVTCHATSYNFDRFYFAIAGEGNQNFSLDNIIVKSETVDFEERFYSGDIHPEIKAYGVSFEVVRPESSLTLTEAKQGDSVQYNTPVNAETSIIEDLEVLKTKFNVSIANAGDAIAYAFGVAEEKTYSDASCACVIEKDGLKVVRYENGAETVLLEKVAADFSSAKEVQIVANKNGEITVSVDGEEKGTCKTDAENYYVGYFGFYSVQENSGAVSLDEVRLVSQTYKVPVTKSVSHNFSNDFFGNEGYEDFVMNVDAGRIQVVDGKLSLEGIADSSYFGSAYEYDDFMVDYKLCSIKTGEKGTAADKWLGLDIGRSTSGKTQYGTHFMLAYHITPTAAEVGLWSYVHETSSMNQEELNKNIVQHKRIPASYFEAIQYDDVTKTEGDVLAKDALCIRYVAENGTVRMYLKRAFEKEYELYATVSGVDTMGYVTINCTGFTTLKIDDFSVSNISSVYINADTYVPETIIKENQVTIYDKSNVDTLAFEEVQANAQGGCGSVITATWGIAPALMVAVALLKKKRKDEEQ